MTCFKFYCMFLLFYFTCDRSCTVPVCLRPWLHHVVEFHRQRRARSHQRLQQAGDELRPVMLWNKPHVAASNLRQHHYQQSHLGKPINRQSSVIYRVKFSDIFPANGWEFLISFYTPIIRSYVR